MLGKDSTSVCKSASWRQEARPRGRVFCFHFQRPGDKLQAAKVTLFACSAGSVRQYEGPGWAGLGFHFRVSCDNANAPTG